MQYNKWTLGLAAIGAISLGSVAHADESTPVMTAVSSTTLSGYVDTSAEWNFGTGNGHAPGYKYGGANKADGFNLNAVQVVLEKPLDDKEWAAGYKVDMMFGPDANVLNTISTSAMGAASDFALKQAYVALRAPVGNGIDIKMGVFDSIIGYESTESVKDPNFTRSWAHTFEPSTHTGILASYRVNSVISFSAGVADTYGPSINERANTFTSPNGVSDAESYKTYMGSISLTVPDGSGFLSGSSLYGGIVNGFNSNVAHVGAIANETSFYAGATIATPVTGLRFGASYDYAGVSNQALTTGLNPSSGYFNAVAGYLSYQFTEKLSLHERAEYATLSRVIAGALDNSNFSGFGGIAARNLAITTTLQYDLWKNVITRAEFRWDHDLTDGHAFGGDNAFGDGTRNNSFELIGAVAYKF
jgi:hypothetical protein